MVSTSLKNRKVNYVSSSHFYVWNPVTSIILHFKIHCHLKKTGKKTEKQCKKKHVSSPMRKTAPGISVQAKVRCCPPRDTWKPPFLGGPGTKTMCQRLGLKKHNPFPRVPRNARKHAKLKGLPIKKLSTKAVTSYELRYTSLSFFQAHKCLGLRTFVLSPQVPWAQNFRSKPTSALGWRLSF